MSWLRRLFGSSARDRELDAELRFHLEQQIEEHVASGLTPLEARRRALVDFGGVDRIAEDCRDARGTRAVESALQDVGYGLRMLRRNPGFTLVAVVSLALGLGANATIFGVTSAVVLRRLPFPRADRLVRLYEVDPRGASWPFSGPNLLDLGRNARLLSAVAGLRPIQRTLTGHGAATPVDGAAVTASFFRVLGLSPAAGTTFTEAAEESGADQHVAVITRSLWTSRLLGDPAAIGGTIRLDGEAYRLAGVVDDVPDLVPGAQVFVPLDLTSTEGRDAREIEAIGLLAADATLAQVEAELEGLGRAAAGRHPSDNAGWSLRAADLKSSILGPVVPRMMWVQFGAAALFGLLACVNVAGLLLARGTARRGELSVRAALGASRGRLVRQLLVESALLAAVGAMAGLTLTAGALAAVRRLGPSTVPRLADVRLDGPVLLFTLALSALVVLGFGLAPAIEGARVGLQERLRQGTRPVTSRTRGRSALVAAQAAIAMTLLVGAGLLFKSFLTLSAVDPGFDPARLLVVRPVLAGAGWPDGRLVPFVSDLSDRLGRLPRVEAAGATNVAPLGTWSSAIRYRRADRSPDAPLLQANWRTVTPGFFRAMGLRLLNGRLLDERDTAEAPEVVVVTDSLAMRTWPGEDPLGRQIVWGRTGPPKTVVGVVSDLRDHFLDREAQPTMFRAFPQLPWSDVTFIVRAGSDPGSLVAEVRRAVQEAAPDVGVRIEPAERLVSNVLLQPRVNTMVFSAFALLALVLAAVGLYGLVSYTVRLRQRETAIRVALGAQPASLLWTLLRHATLLVLVGGVAGLAGGVALSRSLAALLYDTSPGDPFAYGLMFLVLAIVSLLAALGPARRALGVDPVAVLRHE